MRKHPRVVVTQGGRWSVCSLGSGAELFKELPFINIVYIHETFLNQQNKRAWRLCSSDGARLADGLSSLRQVWISAPWTLFIHALVEAFACQGLHIYGYVRAHHNAVACHPRATSKLLCAWDSPWHCVYCHLVVVINSAVFALSFTLGLLCKGFLIHVFIHYSYTKRSFIPFFVVSFGEMRVMDTKTQLSQMMLFHHINDIYSQV